MTQGARICPHCKRRVDERRSKGLAYCLSCGQPLAGFAQTSGPPSMSAPSLGGGTPPPSQYGGAPPSQYGAPPSQVADPYSVPGQVMQPQYGPPASQYGNAPAQNFGGAVNPYATQSQPQQMNPQQMHPQKSGGSAGLIIGILVGLGGIAALIIAVIVLLVGRSSSSSSTPTASDPDPTSTVAIESPTASTDDKPSSSGGATASHHVKPSGSSSSGKNGEETATNGTQPFPLSIANEKMDQAVLTAQRICPRTEGPFGTMIVDITFETDGRIGTLAQKPIGGTPEGNCVTAQFLEIRVGAFAGTPRTFPRSVTLRSPSGAATPSATSSGGRSTRPDAGH